MRPVLVVAAGTVFTLTAAFAACAQEARHPDLTGVWSNASVTQLERRAGTPLVISEEEAERRGQNSSWVRRLEADASGVVPNLDDGNVASGYNAGWMDPGASLAVVNGEYRTSWLVEPRDGRLPLTEAGVNAQRASRMRQQARDVQNPEDLSPNDRCLISSRGTGGPGMLNNLYNNNFQFVQTGGHLAIWVEMVHDVRVIPIFDSKSEAVAAHLPEAVTPWLGDPVGWWEGETLVVETTNIHPTQGTFGPIYMSGQGKVTEHFTRVADDEIFYAFDVEDPVYYTRPWRAELSLRALDGHLYEFACHEGNYAMEGILAGARHEEETAQAD